MPGHPDLPSEVSMVMLGVEDLSRSVEFYRDTLGLAPHGQSAEFAFFAAGGISLALSVPLGRAVQPRSGAAEVIFRTASVEKAHALLAERGCVFVNEPREVMQGSWAATFTDPDGHHLTLFGPK